MTKAERTRELIITKAAPLFNTKGVAGTSMSDILEVTKLAKGSLYVHFEDKEDLAHAVVDYHIERLGKAIETALGKADSAQGKLLAYIDLFMDPVNPLLAGGCPMLNFGMESDDTDQVIRKKICSFMDTGLKLIYSIIKSGKDNGEFKADWDGKEFSIRMFATIEGGIMMSRIAGDNKTMKVIARGLKKEIEDHSA
ncbi:TetR/AcrR family transcriptional regulator [Ohtaekwangia kribbensis]|jgi:TetR/AcrR family transcriptional repressor of nem operon|uniref:TetR/AcrR family transcriptional regulator n=1 Tax=Ohtaekwangia kribbensis TaxID=688913 RepID=A0ABW3K5T0_9BACT